MIKQKVGRCIDCPPESEEQPLIAKRCQAHYWRYRGSLKDEKPKDQARRSHIPAKSLKQIDREIKYAQIRKKWLPQHPHCEAKLPGCQIAASQVHHKQGREGSLLFDTEKWLAVCHKCHAWITEHSNKALEIGLSLRRNL